MTLIVGASESREKDGVIDDLAVGLKTARDELALHMLGGTVVDSICLSCTIMQMQGMRGVCVLRALVI